MNGYVISKNTCWLMFLPSFDVLCELSQYRPTVKSNLRVLYNYKDISTASIMLTELRNFQTTAYMQL